VIDGLHHLRGPPGPGGGQDLALEQQLAGEQRAVDRTHAQYYLRRSHQ